jgi:hypothetical protein
MIPECRMQILHSHSFWKYPPTATRNKAQNYFYQHVDL